jgi:hypothetical protein
MKNRRVNRAQRNRLRVEVLESRLAPATLVNPTTVTYKDVDGDLVTVEISQPLFNSGTINNVFLFDSGSVNGNNAIPQQLQKVDLTALGSAASQLSLDVTAQAGANVGFINATGIDLKSVLVAGDLGKIDAGDTTTSTPGLQSLHVRSMGALGTTTQAAGGDLFTVIQGELGQFLVDTNIVGASISVVGGADGKIGTVQIGEDIRGGSGDDSGEIKATGSIAGLSVGGSVVGGDGQNSGVILSTGGDIGNVTVKGDVQGGGGVTSGFLQAGGNVGDVTLGGSLVGGGGASSAEIGAVGSLGNVNIGGDVRGGTGNYSGQIVSRYGSIGNINIGGSLIGTTTQSARILGAFGGTGSIGTVRIGNDIQGGSGDDSGEIKATGSIAGLSVGGSVVGGDGQNSGVILSTGGDIGNLSIGGDLRGGSVTGTESSDRSGYIQGQRISSVFVGGSIISGSNTGTGTLTRSGSIRAQNDLGPITVHGSLLGNSTNPVIISARGQAVPTTTDVAISRLTVGGKVTYANILAGYDVDGNPVNGGAQIGVVVVGGDWTASNLVAGVSPGPDGLFGTSDDAKISGGSTGILATIARVVIGGNVVGTPASVNATDHFGFVAEDIGAFSVDGQTLHLHAGPHNDDLALGTTGDVTLLEV